MTGIRAEWVVVETAAGGREGPLFSGYRGDLSVGETDDAGLGLLWGGLSELEEREQLAPGERGVVRTYFVNPDVASRFPVGRDFTVNEGRTVVARGRVLEHLTNEPSSRG